MSRSDQLPQAGDGWRPADGDKNNEMNSLLGSEKWGKVLSIQFMSAQSVI